MAQQAFRWFPVGSGFLSLSLLVAACGQAPQNLASDASAPTPSSTTPASPVSAAPASSTSPAMGIAPGDYCYELGSKTLSAQAKVTIDSRNTVSGEFQGTVHNEAAAYYTSYQQTFQGPLTTNNQAKLAVQTQIEYDNQTSEETWTITPDMLKTERESLQKMDCAKFGQNVDETVPDVGQVPPQSNPGTERVNFAKGATSTVLAGAVIRAERKTYLLNAGQDQVMDVGITALEDNAVVEILSPDGSVLVSEAKTFTEKLPATGDYQIIVSGTRGNATYEMTVEIK